MTDRPQPETIGGRFLAASLFALLVVSLYANPLFFRRNFAGRDLVVYNLPMEKAMHGAYARGRIPVWMPEISGGRPLAPNPNAGAMYPVRPLLSVLPFPIAMRIFPVLHWIAAGIGMIFLLRLLGASVAGAWLGAVTYVFSGVGVAEVYFPNLHPGMALLPWVVWEVARRTGSRAGKIVRLSFFYGLMFLAGDVFTIGMAILASCLWILVEVERADRWRQMGLLCIALLLAALLAAPQILATLLWVPDTNRAALGMQLRESLFFSIHPLRLLELVVPFPFGASWSLDDTAIWGWPVFRYKAMGMFTSLYAGAFAIIALVATRKTTSPGFRFARLLFLIALLISVPPSLVPQAWEKLPSPLPLRNPEKFSVVLIFSLAVVAGLAFDRLRSGTQRRRWILAVAGGLTALAGAAALFPGPVGAAAATAVGSGRYAATASQELPGALAEAGLLWIAAVVALDRLRRPSRVALAVALALLTAAPIVATRKIARTLHEIEVFSPTPIAMRIARMDPSGAFRTLGESLYFAPSALDRLYPDDVYTESGRRSWLQHAQALWGRGSVFNDDFDVGDFSRLQALRRLSVAAGAYRDSQKFYANFGLRWGVRFHDQKPLAGYRPFGRDVRQYFDELPEALPDIRLARSWVEEARVLDALTRVPQLQPEEAVLETGRRARGSARSGIVHVLVKDPERIVVETVTPDPSWLFVLRGFWSYRDVFVDGRPVEVVPAQVAFSAVPVPAGRHRIEWKELLPGSGVSQYGPLLWALFCTWLFVRYRRKKPNMTRRLGAAAALCLLFVSTSCSRRRTPPPITKAEVEIATRTPEAWLSEEPIRLLRDYVRIDTSLEHGEAQGTAFLKQFFECEGIETEVICPQPGRCNIFARLPGHRREGALLLLNHIDVAPGFPTLWKEAPPFEGRIKAGYLYGRGVYDMKGTAIAQALAMRNLKRRGIVPASDVLFLGEADEEVGQKLGSRWLLEHRPELFHGVGQVLNEGGVIELVIREPRYWGIETVQAGYASAELEAPEAAPLAALADRWRKLHSPIVEPDPQIVQGFGLLANHLVSPLTDPLRHLDRVRLNPAELAILPDRYGSFLEARAFWSSPFPAGGGPTSPHRIVVVVSTPPGMPPERYFDPILADAKSHGITPVQAFSGGVTSTSPYPTPFTDMLRRVTESHFPGIPFGPLPTSGSFSTSMLFRRAGFPTYGFSTIPMNITDSSRRHRNDERVYLPDFLAGVRMFSDVVEEFALTSHR